ncbi:ubiquitin carboxyl-terminal hydrolase [Seminavis robusta]|uniref:Ubiquitin carboxyl-terminal hydrolase n=1 Tax=Seminavis robusta TaxID=568900 RepID=A0A9N8DRI4_9STRA|nr:ubiquitin carboxyl-terminal hydrolase [Seminavis robusta]|eukprot:Sro229_g093010.1 ubiquitin carboxyl-terminal hydrolase (396) ;mRNA; r:39660-40847
MSDTTSNGNTNGKASSTCKRGAAFHVVGDAFVDLFSFLDGDWPEKGGDAKLNRPIATFAGGSSTNTATHLNSLLGYFDDTNQSSMLLHTTLNPDDHYGSILLNHAQKHGFSLVNCKRPDDTAATAHCVAIVAGQERSFMSYRGCLDNFHASHLDSDSIIDSPSHVHINIAGYYNLNGFQNGLMAQELQRIRKARAQKFPHCATVVSLVPQHDATKQWDGGIDQLAQSCLDFFIMNELEAKYIMEQGLLRRGKQPPQEANSDDLLQNCAAYFGELCPRACIVLTRGPAGAVALLKGDIYTQQSTVKVTPIDPTGAGDSFTAGFLYGLWDWKRPHNGDMQFNNADNTFPWPTQAIQHALKWGCAMGTSAVLVRGASIPSSKETVQRFYSEIEQLKEE